MRLKNNTMALLNDVSSNDNSCLICGDNQSHSSSVRSMFENDRKSQNDQEDEILKPHLWSVFVLTKVLQYPKEKCSEILLKSSGVVNPGDWFTLCDQCCSVVKIAYQLTRQMFLLEREFQHLRTELAIKLGNSFDKGHVNIVNDDSDTLILNVQTEIRNYFRPEIPSPEVSFQDEDTESRSMASYDPNEDNTDASESDCSEISAVKDSSKLRRQRYLARQLKTNVTTTVSPSSKPSKPSKVTLAKGPGCSRQYSRPKPITKTRPSPWLQAPGEEPNPKKWRPIDKELYHIYRSLPRQAPAGEKIPCPICGSEFRHIRVHMLFHRARYYQFVCSICKFAAKSQSNLHYHMATRHKELGLKIERKLGLKTPHKCHICKPGHMYSTKKQLVMHLALHEKHSQTSCPTCHFPCVSEINLRNHKRRYHTVRVKIQCDKCDFVAKSQQLMNQHLKTAHAMQIRRSQPFKCNRCDFTTGKSSLLESHANRHSALDNAVFDEGKGTYTCKLCGAEFTNETSCIMHISQVHKSELSMNLFPCDHCDKSFMNEVSLKQHTWKFHETHHVARIRRRIAKAKEQLRQHPKTARKKSCSNVFRCNRCDFVASKYTTFKLHTARHSTLDNAIVDESTGTYCCKVCNSKFDRDISFIQHFSHSHKSELSQDLVLCHYCHKTFTCQPNLEHHIRNIHLNPVAKKRREIVCELCTKTFWTEAVLERHKRLKHSDAARKNVCDQCGMIFTQKFALRKHQRQFHPVLSELTTAASTSLQVLATSERQCEHCGLTCVNFKAFKDHLREAHPNLYKFHCELCPAKYLSRCNLRTHVRSCHGQGKESCKWHGAEMKSYSMYDHIKNNCKQNPARNTKTE